MIANEIQFADVAQAVERGFAQVPKRLPSWLFYDETGDKIFQEIMHMPEYYLSRCEYEILETFKSELLVHFNQSGAAFNLIELGAGDGLKTEILLEHFISNKADFVYSPVDVSESILNTLDDRLEKSLPQLKVLPINSKYDEALENLDSDYIRKVLLFMGANIGNFSINEGRDFVKSIANRMHTNDQLLIGFDLKKDPYKILAAYNDAHGITRRFNLNLLVRLNRELGANFDISRFIHYPFYDPATGTAKSFLVSLESQEVYLAACDKTVSFKQWEVIHIEISQKFDFEMINQLAKYAGLRVVETFYDSQKYFCDVLLECH